MRMNIKQIEQFKIKISLPDMITMPDTAIGEVDGFCLRTRATSNANSTFNFIFVVVYQAVWCCVIMMPRCSLSGERDK